MSQNPAEVTAHRLTARIDDLARSLAHAGVSTEQSSRLLELAAVAAMHAVSLTEVASARPDPPRRQAENAEPAARPVRAIAA